jgi:outer membrane lipoprotein-sorting protein
MSEFKFSCPHCDQHIAAPVGYAGAQINCPACQKLIVVPAGPVVVPPPPAPTTLGIHRPAPPVTNAPANPVEPAPAKPSAYRSGTPPPAQKSGSKTMKTILVVAAVVAVLGALGVGGWFGYSKLKAKHEAAVAAKGNPAAIVAPPTSAAAGSALDILAKVHDAYAHLPTFSAEGNSVSIIDMSAVTAADMNPNATAAQKKKTIRPAGMPRAITNLAAITIKLARPDSYLIQSISKMAMGRNSMTNTTAVWSAGQTNFSLMMMSGGAYKSFTMLADRKTAFMMSAQSGGLTMATAELFFDEANDMSKFITEWGQTDDDSLNGEDCYTLTAKMMGQKLKVWVSKSSYLLQQLQITLGAPLSDTDIDAAMALNSGSSKMTPAQTAQMKAQAKTTANMMTKIRGVITETYSNIDTNKTFAADDFNYPVPHGVRLSAPMTMGAANTTTSTTTSTEARWRNACINNLRQIDAAKNQFALENKKTTGDVVTEADIKPYIKLDADGNLPKCPAGGKYVIGKVGENPTCSIDGHVLP